MTSVGLPPARLAAVIGSPVGHSLSPVIHRAAFAAAAVDWSYVAFNVAPGKAAEALRAMRILGIGGLSVTMPHKTDVARLVDRLDSEAAMLQAANTVSWDGDELVGSSTDGAGFVASLHSSGVKVVGAKVAVLGAGGAARAVIDALGRAGASDIVVINRTSKAAKRAAALTSAASVGIVDDVSRADIVVNATSVGMGVNPEAGGENDLPCDPTLFRPGQVVADLVYYPLETMWLRRTADVGALAVDGLGMLVHQAALQQQIWLGPDAVVDIAAMRAAAEAAIRSG